MTTSASTGCCRAKKAPARCRASCTLAPSMMESGRAKYTISKTQRCPGASEQWVVMELILPSLTTTISPGRTSRDKGGADAVQSAAFAGKDNGAVAAFADAQRLKAHRVPGGDQLLGLMTIRE